MKMPHTDVATQGGSDRASEGGRRLRARDIVRGGGGGRGGVVRGVGWGG